MNKGKYVYCFIEGRVNEPVDLMGIGKYGKVYFLSCQDITIALSDTPLIAFDPSKDNAMSHEKIIHHLMKSYNLVPCSFGNVFKSKEDVITFMDKAYNYIHENLEKVRDRMEVGLRVFWKKEAFSQEIETKEIVEFRDSIQKKSQGENYLLKVELGKKVEAQVNKRREYYVRNIYDPLTRQAAEAVLSDANNPLMVLNASFLILKSKEREFDSSVEAFMKKYANSLEFSYSGPWPPYNFTSIEVKR